MHERFVENREPANPTCSGRGFALGKSARFFQYWCLAKNVLGQSRPAADAPVRRHRGRKENGYERIHYNSTNP